MTKFKPENNYKKLFNLENKNAYVLGGSGLLGKEISKVLFQYGASVKVLDLKEDTRNKNLKFIKFDYRKKNFESEFKRIFKHYGSPDVFINASYPKNSSWSKSSIEKIKLTSFLYHIEKWSISHVWITKLVAEQMKMKKIHGKIINIGSIYGVVSQNPDLYKKIKGMNPSNIIYSFIKGGLQTFTKQMAVLFGKHNIKINTINAGGVIQRKNSKIISPNKKFIKKYSDNTPLKRMAEVSEIASVALFLSSDASSYITGSNILVDGGWTAT